MGSGRSDRNIEGRRGLLRLAVASVAVFCAGRLARRLPPAGGSAAPGHATAPTGGDVPQAVAGRVEARHWRRA